MKEAINNYKEKVDRKLIIRQRIFFVIISILMVINIVNTVYGKVSVTLAISSILVATIVGILLNRMFKIFWHEEREKIVSQLDKIGTILLVLYIGIEVGRNWFFGYWLSGPALTAFGLIVLTGLLTGRFLGTIIQIKKILSESESSN